MINLGLQVQAVYVNGGAGLMLVKRMGYKNNSHHIAFYNAKVVGIEDAVKRISMETQMTKAKACLNGVVRKGYDRRIIFQSETSAIKRYSKMVKLIDTKQVSIMIDGKTIETT